MSETKIQISKLYKIFGKNPKSALEQVKDGVDKDELLEKHNHVLGLKDINLDIEEKSKVDELFNLYSSIGYKCFKVSGKKLLNIESLEREMKNKTCVFTGHSGSGKSTLLNSIDSSLNIKTSIAYTSI